MNEKFLQEYEQQGSLEFVLRKLSERREEILTAIAERKVEPTGDLMIELASLNVALGDVTEVGNASQ